MIARFSKRKRSSRPPAQMTVDKPNRRTEIKLQPPSYISDNYIGFGLYGRIALLRDDPSRVFKFCEPDNRDGVETIKPEKKILTMLGAHPFIIQLHWVSERGLCFEYYPLGSLRTYYHTMLPSLPEITTRTRWCHQFTEGIAFIHSKGIVHNDIGARNTLISSSMDIKICDLGFATNVWRRCCACQKQGTRDIALGLPMRVSWITYLPLGHCFTRFCKAPGPTKISKAPKSTSGSNHSYFRR